jgi:hypothetical protein
MKQRPANQNNQKSLTMYAALQTLTLLVTWGWFAALWSVAIVAFTLEDLEWWFLVASACAGLYGLRPNLERAIDTVWLQGITDAKALGERFAQLKPIKRRVAIVFSLVTLTLLTLLLVFYTFNFAGLPNVA